MATIGTFKKTGNNEFVGEIVTLSVQAKNVRIVPESSRSAENAPSHRVFVGRAEIGAAWSKRSGEGRDYLSAQAGRSELQRSDLREPLRRRGRRELHAHLVPRPQGQRRLSRPSRGCDLARIRFDSVLRLLKLDEVSPGPFPA